MEFKYIDINLLKQTKNIRDYKHSKYFLYESIKDYGFINPILVDANNNIICGNLRYIIAKELNYKELPCIIINELNDKQIKEYKILDNHITELSLWNYKDKKDYIKNNELSLTKYNLPEDYDIEINIDDFFEKEKIERVSIFDLEVQI